MRVLATYKGFMRCSGTCVCDLETVHTLRVLEEEFCSVCLIRLTVFRHACLPAALSCMHTFTLTDAFISALLQTVPRFKVSMKYKFTMH